LLSPSSSCYNKKKAMVATLPSPFAFQKKPRKEGDAAVAFYITPQRNEKKKTTTTTLPSPSLLHQNENKR
jgi:hypothetical protein